MNCCCFKPTNEDDLPDLNISINCTNACCQNTYSDKEREARLEKNLLRRIKSSIIRRNKEAKSSNKSPPGESIEMVESAVDLCTSQESEEKVSTEKVSCERN